MAQPIIIAKDRTKVTGNYGIGDTNGVFVPVQVTDIEDKDTYSLLKATVNGQSKSLTNFEIFGAKIEETPGNWAPLGEVLDRLYPDVEEHIIPAAFEAYCEKAVDDQGEPIMRYSEKRDKYYPTWNVAIQAVTPQDFVAGQPKPVTKPGGKPF